ncbi:hypothetical protein Q8F55_004536 [Vanrija albida]|uniref:Uncharacterized protein n=1 Tax=Vanrija albida TaxID=181172 RepID=A0ABR3Q860_9TREE
MTSEATEAKHHPAKATEAEGKHPTENGKAQQTSAKGKRPTLAPAYELEYGDDYDLPPSERLPPYSACRGGERCHDHGARPAAPRQPSYSAWAPSRVHGRAGLSALKAREKEAERAAESEEQRRARVRREQDAELAHWREQVALATKEAGAKDARALEHKSEAPRATKPSVAANRLSRIESGDSGPSSLAPPHPQLEAPALVLDHPEVALHTVPGLDLAPAPAPPSPPPKHKHGRKRAGTSPVHSRSPSPTSLHTPPPHTASSSSLSSYRSATPATPPDTGTDSHHPLPAWCTSPLPTPRLTRSHSAPALALLTLEDLEGAYVPARVPPLRRKVTPNHLRAAQPVIGRLPDRMATRTAQTTASKKEKGKRERNAWSPSEIANRLSPRALAERPASPPAAAELPHATGPPSPSRNRPFSFFRRPTRQYRLPPVEMPHGHEHNSALGRPPQHPHSEHTYARVPPRLFEQWPTRLPIEYKLWCTPFLGYDEVRVEPDGAVEM